MVLQPPRRQYISGIYCQWGDYIPPDPTFYGNQKQPLTKKNLGFQRRCVFVRCVNSCKKPLFLRIFHEQIQGDSCFYSLGIAGYGPQQFHSRRRGSFVRAPGLTWESLATRPSPDLRTSGPTTWGLFFFSEAPGGHPEKNTKVLQYKFLTQNNGGKEFLAVNLYIFCL